jgi:uncharacterized protein (UPF0303 family)
MPSPDDDLRLITEQERLLHFPSFSSETAWTLGSSLRAEALAHKAGMTFEIQIAGRTLFACSTEGAAPGQADWIRRKRNVVMRFARSSYAMRLQLQLEGKTIEERHGLTLTDYAMRGGGLPILLAGTGLVGSVVSSGLDERTDHGLVVKAMAGVLGVNVPALP